MMSSKIPRKKGKVRRSLAVLLGLTLFVNALTVLPVISSAAVPPLPGPHNPVVFDDFAGGGVFNQNWMNWWNQDGGTGSFTKTTADSREVGQFAQTPASASSWAKFQPWHESVDLTGYKYLNVTWKDPGYPDSRIRFIVLDGTVSYNLTGGWVPVPTSWTTTRYDLDTMAPNLNKSKAKFEIWLRQTGGSYGEVLIDEIFASTDESGTAPLLTGSMTANMAGSYNQNTNFTFRATYTDADNEKPFAMQLVVNDETIHNMMEVNHADTDYTDGKDYIFITKLPPGTHTYYYRTTDLTSDEVNTSVQSGPVVSQSEQVIDVVVSQAGYHAAGFKSAKVTSLLPLNDTAYEIKSGTTAVKTGNITYEGVTWDKHVYSIDFSDVTAAGLDYTIVSNGVASYPFPIQTNMWTDYKDEMTAFYRLQRASVATTEAYPAGYSSIAPSARIYHPAGHLDDAQSEDGTANYDLTGGWYDAGDYGKYAGNQWVGTQIALAYIRHKDADDVKFDNDTNGIPDLVDEAIFGSEYLIKWANQLGGALYDLKNNAGGFVHPHKTTDGLIGTSDDRKLSNLGVAGSAKAASTLAATARAIHTAIAEGDIAAEQVAALQTFAEEAEDAAVVFYSYVIANPDGPLGSYSTRGGIPNAKLLADVQLYLLTQDTDYLSAAVANANTLTISDIYSTNYWDMRPMALAELYPVADPTTQAHIQLLLKQQVDYFLSSTDDTPYGVLNQFKNFGVNEPHASYLGDLMRYYELFQDPAALRAVEKGIYWIFGENPWNISWVSGIGSDFVDFPHTRYDEGSNSRRSGVVLPGAMVSGPNMKDTKDKKSVSPWYEDRSLHLDDTSQWRYNEYSISIQAGLLYTIMGLSAYENADSSGGTEPVKLPTLTPTIGDYVRGEVTVFAGPAAGMHAVDYSASGPSGTNGEYAPMSVSGEVYAATIDESGTAPYANKRVDVRGTDANGNMTYSSTHYTVAAPLPDPSTPALYDDFGGGGLWGSTGGNNQWVNWYTQNNGSATYTKTTEDGRTVGKFTQTPAATNSNAKFQPWHDIVDFDGYRYLNFTVKNPGYSDLRMKIELSDGSKGYNLTGGYIPVPATWTELQYDMDALSATLNKKTLRMSIWLNQSTAQYGEMFIDEIKATNLASGSAPTLTGLSLDHSTGDTDTEFTFGVTYTDADNEAPFAMEVVIDGVVHLMEEADPDDMMYTDGKDYNYTTKLPLGIHSYYFHTSDTTSDAVSSTVQTGLVVSGNSVLFSDDFNDGDAAGWTSTSGNWSVTADEYIGQAASGNSYSIAGQPDWTDYTLEAKVNVTNNTNGNKDAGLVFRYTDPDNHYVLYLKNDDRSGRKMELVKVEGGVRTTLDHASPSVMPDTSHTYRIVLSGDEIAVYQDEVLQLSASDSTHASGKIGARVYANTKAIFDNFTVSQ
ncbi:glycoside hydrolase family 9 protein [Paenibacillus sp. 1P07SE]|uniref:glycoside hydrolase family 9 protein n=1 Tax=Paenibacillus sp. 1P07SE TaxID=3132209 RepID=UPI0039A6D92B